MIFLLFSNKQHYLSEAAGVNDPGNILWCTTAWNAGGVDVRSVKTAKRAREGRKQPASALSEKTVTFDPHGAEMGENGAGDGAAGGGVAGEAGRTNGGGGTLAQTENKRLERLQRHKARNASQQASPSHKGSHVQQLVVKDTRNAHTKRLIYSPDRKW